MTNRDELDIERRVRARAERARSVMTGTRWGLRRDADTLRQRVEDRTAHIHALREQTDTLNGQADALRQQAAELLTHDLGHTSYQPLLTQLAQRRTELPAYAAHLHRGDHGRHQRLLRETLTPEQAAAEYTGRAIAAQQRAQARPPAARRKPVQPHQPPPGHRPWLPGPNPGRGMGR